jgi:zinc transport system ATP-binding protein
MNENISIEIRNLTHVFGKHIALENIDLLIPHGTFVSVVGPNGGGKTTLLKCLLGLIEPKSGSINIAGYSPKTVPSKMIGYIPQIKTLDRTFPAYSIELIATGILNHWPLRLSSDVETKCCEALNAAGASHLKKRQLNELSGGELQRIYFARSIVRKPKILILDEPATGIDISAENDMNLIIDDYKERYGAIVVMVTHDWESAYHHADKALMLNVNQICYDSPDVAFSEDNMRKVFGHVGHTHDMLFRGNKNV